MTIRALFFRSLAFAATAVLGGSGWCAPPLTVAWRDKPPYHYTERGETKGFLLERVKTIFSAAGVPAQFVNEPQKRIWANFTHGATNYCSINWYRLPEREAVAVRHDFPDMPPGMKRHILRSKDVAAETMAKLNQAIAATGGMNNPGHSVKPK